MRWALFPFLTHRICTVKLGELLLLEMKKKVREEEEDPEEQ
jgi:hypothetical protein